jgi:hypothetical protein
MRPPGSRVRSADDRPADKSFTCVYCIHGRHRNEWHPPLHYRDQPHFPADCCYGCAADGRYQEAKAADRRPRATLSAVVDAIVTGRVQVGRTVTGDVDVGLDTSSLAEHFQGGVRLLTALAEAAAEHIRFHGATRAMPAGRRLERERDD